MIRPASDADAEAIADLLTQLGYPTPPAPVPGRLRRLRVDGQSEAFVAEHEGSVAGLATVHVQASLTRGDDVAQLTTLVVAERARGIGLGRALVGAAESFARERGCGRLVVTTANHRADAHAFYDRLGWEWTGRRYARAL